MNRHPQVPGYQVTGVAGAGSGQAVWSARAANGERVVIRIVRPATAPERERLERRWQALASVASDGVARALACVDMSGGELATVCQHIDGPTLGTMLTARQGLTEGECLALARRLLSALAAMHAAGLVHGDVAPSNVVLAPEEGDPASVRPVLIDVAPIPGCERGTPGFTAPELAQGRALSAQADVYAVGALAVGAARPADRPRVHEALQLLLSEDPSSRPSARDAARSLATEQAPVRAAEARLLAAATLRSHASRTRTTRAPARRRRARHRRRAVRPVAILAAVVIAVGALVASETTDPAPAARQVVVPSSPGDVLERVVELTDLRDRALESGDRELLTEVSVPGSAAAEADAAVLARLVAAGVELDGLTSHVSEVELLELGSASARVRLEVAHSDYRRDAPGGRSETVDATQPRCATMELSRLQGAWRVAEVRDC
ncbi:protein kinase [Ruania suaedae]|uniref:protein kinase domain-containing protein n=1 Tax=Ruania suaedae TaxID=2897774 RepID=UPI001E38099E|nr:protein kinase [Ruania suaedae]UFU01659.1 protein kinase [Ruania suaedae]